MSSDWPLVAVEDVCELIVDCVNKTAPVVPTATPYRMIRTTNVRNGRIDLNDCRCVEQETYDKWTRRARLQAGDVILTREAPIGEVGLVKEYEGVFLGQRLMQYRANPKLLDSRFLLYSFLSPALQHQFGSHEGSGSVVSHIRVGDCFKFKLRLPPLSEQKKIADLLGALDDRIALLRETNATLEAVAQALFKSWFVDFDPVHARALGEEPAGLSPEVAALFPASFEESELGMIPKGWRVGELGQEVRISYGKNLPTTKLLDAGFPVYGGNGQIGFFDSYLYKDRQVLVACRGAASGKVNQSVPEAFITNNSLVLESTELLTFSYLKGFMTRADLTPYVTGSAQPQVTIDNLKNFKILVPPQPMVAHYEAFAGLIENRIEGNCLQAQSLATLRDTLLPRLISGQLRLPEAEAMVEAVS
ncbi:restriction endonuclease subunit S [Aeromonas caviae]|uniref:restriction endonuclease subunit S n=1 Tax=Aeromonas TaxID=642 RepID=UPI000DD06C99|nr:restriction endonuclease subunit S [Aeromonas caviae]MBL0539573.1 restriction endonuclease subunit S [Aeromonas caviae]